MKIEDSCCFSVGDVNQLMASIMPFPIRPVFFFFLNFTQHETLPLLKPSRKENLKKLKIITSLTIGGRDEKEREEKRGEKGTTRK